MAPRWSEDTTVKFLELYRERPSLWDQTSDLYKNKTARESAMSEIVSAMNIDGFGIPEAKLKIKALRVTHIGEVSKVEKSAQSGAGAADVYVPTVKWFAIMKFIMDRGTLKRGTKSTLVHPKDSMKRKGEIEMEENDGAVSLTEADCEVESEQQEIEANAVDPGTVIREEVATPTAKRFKARSKIQQIANTARELKALSCSIKPTADNEYEIFGKHVAAQLKELSTRQAIIAVGKINSVLTECRLADIDMTTSTTPSSCVPSHGESSNNSNDIPQWDLDSSQYASTIADALMNFGSTHR